MFKDLKISKKLKKQKSYSMKYQKRNRKLSQQLLDIKLSRRSSFGSMMEELSLDGVKEQLERLPIILEKNKIEKNEKKIQQKNKEESIQEISSWISKEDIPFSNISEMNFENNIEEFSTKVENLKNYQYTQSVLQES